MVQKHLVGGREGRLRMVQEACKLHEKAVCCGPPRACHTGRSSNAARPPSQMKDEPSQEPILEQQQQQQQQQHAQHAIERTY